MSGKYGDYIESVDNGESVEQVFMSALKKRYPNCIVSGSTKFDNKNRHIDVYFRLGDKCRTTFDVKAQKKVNRYDENANDEYTWVELQNNQGFRGWAYGEEKYLAFEWENAFIIVERAKLLDLVNNNKVEGLITENRDIFEYCQYQRSKYGNEDICVLTPIRDIIEIAHKIIEK